MGLDHTYFLAEMERVASGLGSMIGAFQRKGHHAMRCGFFQFLDFFFRGDSVPPFCDDCSSLQPSLTPFFIFRGAVSWMFSVWDMDMLGELASYSSLMDDLMGSVVSGEMFDPAELMRQLYDVEGALQRARLGPEAVRLFLFTYGLRFQVGYALNQAGPDASVRWKAVVVVTIGSPTNHWQEPIAEAPRIYSGYDDDVVSDGSGGGYYHDGYYDDPYDEYYDDRW